MAERHEPNSFCTKMHRNMHQNAVLSPAKRSAKWC